MKEFNDLRHNAENHIEFVKNNAADAECDSVKKAVAQANRFIAAIDFAEAQMAKLTESAQGKAPAAEIEKRVSLRAASIAGMMKAWVVRGYGEAADMASEMFKVQF